MRLTKSHIALILTIALFLASCKTPQRIATEQQQSLRVNAERQEQMLRNLLTEVQQLQHQQMRQQTASRQQVQMDADDLSEIITEEYDATQPVDTATGTPPLKTRTIEKRNRHVQTRAAQAQKSETEHMDIRQTTLHHTEQDTATTTETQQAHADTHSDTGQRIGLNWWQTTLCTVGGTAVLAFLIWLALKLLKRYLKPF